MNMKLFGTLIAIVLVGLGVAGYLLFRDSGASVDHPKVDKPDPNQGGTKTETPLTTPDLPSNKGTEPIRVDQKSGDPVFSARGDLVVKGVVRNRADKAPLTDVEVTVHDEEGDPVESGKTGANGEYTVTIVGDVPRKISVTTSLAGFASEIALGDVVAGDHREMTFDFDLSSEFYIEGHVTNAATGAPVAEASVSVRCLEKAFSGESGEGMTDAGGYYKIGPISDLPRGGFDVYTEPDDLAPMVKYDQKVPDGKSIVTVDFAVYASLTLTGTVVARSTQKPLEEALILGKSRDPEFTDNDENESTDDKGSFRLEFEATPYDRLFVLISHDGYGPVAIDKLPAPQPDGVVDLGRIELPDQVTLSGVVYNKRTGQPVAGGDVRVFCSNAPPDLGEDDSESIDTNGHFEMKLEYTPTDRARIEIDANDCSVLEQDLRLDPTLAIQAPVRFDVDPLLILRGKVTNKSDGKPVIGAVILITPASKEAKRQVTRVAAADGSYKMGLPTDTRFEATDVLIKYSAKTFNLGPLPKPADGTFEIAKDFVIDLPATVVTPGVPRPPMRPKK